MARLISVTSTRHWSGKLPSDGPKTLNGLITEILEFIPEGAVCIQIGPYYLETLEIKDNRISRARLWNSD